MAIITSRKNEGLRRGLLHFWNTFLSSWLAFRLERHKLYSCSPTQREGIMDAIRKPSKQEVRDWLRQAIESKDPPPAPQVIADQLWHNAERMRRSALS